MIGKPGNIMMIFPSAYVREQADGSSLAPTRGKRCRKRPTGRSSAAEMLNFLQEYSEKREKTEEEKLTLLREMKEEKQQFYNRFFDFMEKQKSDDEPCSMKKGCCRICHEEVDLSDTDMMFPCLCWGTTMFVHQDCLKYWLLPSQSTECEVCLKKYDMNVKLKFKEMSKFSPQKSSNKSGGVQWWQQCARSFITPYGRHDEAPEPSKIFKRLQPFTCEWLTRPDVALSEYRDTITSNIPVLQEHGQKVLRKSFADKLKSHFEPTWENMQALNKKKKTPMSLQPPQMSVKNVNKVQQRDNVGSRQGQVCQLGGDKQQEDEAEKKRQHEADPSLHGEDVEEQHLSSEGESEVDETPLGVLLAAPRRPKDDPIWLRCERSRASLSFSCSTIT
ncbi:E3 ubiquitin- ligase MARCH8 isoform X1 [Paramuricea clavata]|uniref:E3 ubiquitin- ligase MARCH8 isoform X1 n=1 Tax=Paramuricea clavata TaxID=317549 RepID=A0A7D9HKN4_PARCT|nr:E3 ubiquitin- ligase MARCH8 isoform X1 [Paramuricea clavata]